MRLLASLCVLVFFVAYTTAEEGEEISFLVQDPRLFATTTATTTVSTTITSTIPCTSGAFAGLANQAAIDALTKCSINLGRRRRGILLEGDEDEQFSISPSATQGVEATQEALSIREGRAADPQYLVLSPFGFQPQIQAGLHGSPFNYYPYGALPYKYVKPVEGQQRAFGTTISSVFNALVPSNLKGTSTSTIFSTFFTVVTSKSTATCSPPPNVLRCDSR
ncbi:hypothetical protein DAPPUDRAFT_220751 [Daphnia pulex]|uniref:Uncharacterized protein n=1 Tax=Daphnia pulex TaxID=6669 RepID=E9FVI0_DAPPU|nr:hypothetical protein DAPPUDRAFT_220751 [Daphnia pulex]|eukprot:EFX89099.1 hypothetical protein DAPPUDRAFT_220751 [Daphnia pulex]